MFMVLLMCINKLYKVYIYTYIIYMYMYTLYIYIYSGSRLHRNSCVGSTNVDIGVLLM